MTPHRDQDEDEDDWADDEADSGDDLDCADDEPTVPCPYCKEEILEDSPYCPHCEQYISEEGHGGPRKPLWIFVTALICLGIAICWLCAPFW